MSLLETYKVHGTGEKMFPIYTSWIDIKYLNILNLSNIVSLQC